VVSFSPRRALPEVLSGWRGLTRRQQPKKLVSTTAAYGCALCGKTVGVSPRADETHRESTLVFPYMDFGMILAAQEW
jgi:hypothetical protein